MDIVALSPAGLDDRTAAELAALRNAAAAVDAPHTPPETGDILRARMVHGWGGEGTERLLLARDGHDRLLGFAEVETPRQENRNLVYVGLSVHPDLRRRGAGTALLESVVEVCDETGRGLLMSGVWDGTAGPPFLRVHGFEQASVAAQRRLFPQDLPRPGDDALLARARAASADYEMLHVRGPLPEELLPAMVETVAAINDAPLDDLELEDDHITVDRLRRYDAAQLAQGHRLYRVIARDRRDGALAGHSVVAVDGRRPHLGEQHDTTVRREHRGHRLGLRLKLEMLQWLRETEPQLRQVDTWNQESNAYMIAVNDAIGCVVVGREAQFQKHVPAVAARLRNPAGAAASDRAASPWPA